MNAKQFKSFVKNLSETKATRALLGHSSICSMGAGGNVFLEDVSSATQEHSDYYLVNTEQLLDVSKKLKATKEAVGLSYENGKLSISAGLAIYDAPAKRIEMTPKKEGNDNVVLTETTTYAESVKQFLITASVLPQKDEAEFMPISTHVHVFCRPDDIFTMESVGSTEEVRLDSVILTGKPIKGRFAKAELANLSKVLKSLGYVNMASIYLKRNSAKAGAKICIELKTADTRCILSLPLERKVVDKPFLPSYASKEGLLLLDQGSEESIVEQLTSLTSAPTPKQAQAIAREFPDMVKVISEDTHTILYQNGLQHCFSSLKDAQ